MAEALYRKYRSKSLDEVVGQEHITTTLKNALKSGKISHAYLFSGPKGVGKTSIARILAYAVNDIPYEDSAGLLDIIEIDAASNRRIDEIRDLRDRVHIAPATSKYKVYIIDEVHMLTREAFNALLKTLEEPPAHAIFILATTESHKLPETIVSRTQRFMFKPVPANEVVKHLQFIAKSEKLQVSQDALELIAQHGEGSFRDSISLLDQARSIGGNSVEAKDIELLLGLPPAHIIEGLFDALVQGDTTVTAQLVQQVGQGGYDSAVIASSLSERLRSALLDGRATIHGVPVTNILEKLLGVPGNYDPERYLEIVLLEVTVNAPQQQTAELRQAKEPIKEAVVETKTIEQPIALPKTTPEKTVRKATAVNEADMWPAVLAEIKTKHNTLYSVVRMATVTYEDDAVILEFSFGFHQKRIDEPKNLQILAETLKQVGGKDLRIQTRLAAKKAPLDTKTKHKSAGSDTLGTITEIFGGGELLED